MKCDYFEYCGNMAVKYEIDPFCEEIYGEEIWLGIVKNVITTI